MKIAHLLRRFSFAEWGGTETVVWNTAREMHRCGHDPEILATRALNPVAEETKEGISIRRFPYFYPLFPLSAANRARLDKKGGNPWSPQLAAYLRHHDFDLLHCHTMGRLGALARREAARRRIPLVVSFHGGCYDVPAAEIAEMCRPMRHSFNYGRILDLLGGLNGDFVAAADGIICVGYNEYELARQKFPDKAVTYIPNGVDPEHFRTRSGIDFRQRHHLPPGRKIMLCVSRIDYQKNQLALIRMLQLLRESEGPDRLPQLVLIGPITADYYYRDLRAAIAAAGLEEQVTIIPGLAPDDPELPAAYHAADVFALPSRHEPFGIVVLEAWAAGVPVMAAAVGGLCRLITDGETGLLLPSDDAAAMADAWRRLQRDTDLRRRLTATATAAVNREYSWTNITGRVMAFYEEVKHGRNRS
ncbi:MAG: glycosyltransferase family 4 protein [Victivallales bacterium]|nr:glycosyltransferase family 4 protein [Victivallales bacterium]